ncbi:hypothetical protein GLAREA_02312 [Glarea lozoyensis ATCC 20868]|uniref:Uncharacterized protein n=1 Tax=Glarea lozoyensis (strain ATCC 20868 / MF5171) TaxID=1116229 RepID=S3CMG3_GLAL2|nr:uncharacterized protein GLAREA_02312 [Glarea lozoyensis ATCC 20868]EPE26399.1 hypothetical protein GLAREA_02312 [Glarea lozoyensis ATCC 20868]
MSLHLETLQAKGSLMYQASRTTFFTSPSHDVSLSKVQNQFPAAQVGDHSKDENSQRPIGRCISEKASEADNQFGAEEYPGQGVVQDFFRTSEANASPVNFTQDELQKAD